MTALTKGYNRWPTIWEEDIFDLIPLSPKVTDGLDVYETDEDVVVKANVAGMHPDDINVTFEKGVLYISAKCDCNDEEGDKDKKKMRYAQSSWSYSYRVTVPGQIDPDTEPEVELDKGVLTVKFKKSAIAQPKKLNVKSKQTT